MMQGCGGRTEDTGDTEGNTGDTRETQGDIMGHRGHGDWNKEDTFSVWTKMDQYMKPFHVFFFIFSKSINYCLFSNLFFFESEKSRNMGTVIIIVILYSYCTYCVKKSSAFVCAVLVKEVSQLYAHLTLLHWRRHIGCLLRFLENRNGFEVSWQYLMMVRPEWKLFCFINSFLRRIKRLTLCFAINHSGK